MHRVLARLKVVIAPNKTTIGRCRNGFDFLGHRLGLPSDPLREGGWRIAADCLEHVTEASAKTRPA
jgi:hypothetical protein